MAKNKKHTSADEKQLVAQIAAELRRKQAALLQEVAESQEEAKAIADLRESEIEESAQIDRMTRLRSRLDQRGQKMIREIDAALDRIATGVYGKCERCGGDIAAARLQALPTATLCIDCATARERRDKSAGMQENSERPVGPDTGIESSFGTEDREE